MKKARKYGLSCDLLTKILTSFFIYHLHLPCKAYEIVSEESYPVDYNATVDLAKQEQADSKRPELKSDFTDLKECDTIWLAFPNWWTDLPVPVYTFFEKYDLAGKNIYVFVTHEGSGFSSTVNTIRELEPDAKVVKALSVRGGSVTGEESNIREQLQKGEQTISDHIRLSAFSKEEL